MYKTIITILIILITMLIILIIIHRGNTQQQVANGFVAVFEMMIVWKNNYADGMTFAISGLQDSGMLTIIIIITIIYYYKNNN